MLGEESKQFRRGSLSFYFEVAVEEKKRRQPTYVRSSLPDFPGNKCTTLVPGRVWLWQ
jgi:hypothetical protein